MNGFRPWGEPEPIWPLLTMILAMLTVTFFVGFAFGKVL